MENLSKIETEHKAQIINAMIRLSASTFLVVLQYPKNTGIEIEYKDKLGITKEYPKNFLSRFPISQFNNKVSIIRLYPNDNPVLGRIIGVIIKNIFYMLFVDIGGKPYKH